MQIARRFDEAAYLTRLQDAGVCWIARSAPAFPPLLHAIHDPPPGLLRPRRRGPGAAARGAPRLPSSEHARARRTALRSRACWVAPRPRRPGRRERARAWRRRRGAPRCARCRRAHGWLLGCGIDRDYPAAHRGLAAQIATGLWCRARAGRRAGAMAFSGAKQDHRGPLGGDVVVEARDRSGALITADLALEEGREVFAVPGEITSGIEPFLRGASAAGAV